METFSRGTLEPWYVTGLADGDAAFTYSRSGAQIGLYFSIKMTAQERPILERVQGFFGGAGALYRVVPRKPTRYGGFTKEAVLYRVTSRKDLEPIVQHFDDYPLQSAKSLQYTIWREMVLLKRDFRRVDREQLDQLAAQLSAVCMRRRAWDG